MQHLLSRAVWDADEMRDDVRDAAVECLGDTDAMLVVDETGDVKKGASSVRRGAGAMPVACRMFQTVDAATAWPSRVSSP
jgi:SRSO17 transposase